MGLITTVDIHERFEGLRQLASFQRKKEQTAGIVASYKIAFSTDRRFSEPHCEQMEADLKNPPHGFSSDRTHLALLGWIFPENDGFYGDPLSMIFVVAAGKEMGLSRNSPVQSSIWILFLLIFVYLSKRGI